MVVSVGLWLALGGLVLVGAYWLANNWYQKKRDNDLGRIIRILLFEQVGNDKVFKGSRIGREMADEELGVYIMIDKDKKAISDVDNSDLFYDYQYNKYTKCLLVCKYGDDDYRAMARLNDEVWYKKVSERVPVLDKDGEQVVEAIEVTDPETGVISTVKKSKFEISKVEKPYVEALGVGSDSREALRFERRFTKRMQDKRKEVKSWLEKYAPYLTVGFVAVIMLVSFAYMTNKLSETQVYIADTFVTGAGDYKKAVEQPSYAQTLLDSWEKQNAEGNAPPG